VHSAPALYVVLRTPNTTRVTLVRPLGPAGVFLARIVGSSIIVGQIFPAQSTGRVYL